MHTRRAISTLCLMLAIAAAQPSSQASAVPIDSSIPKEAADAIHAEDWEEVSKILKPLADAKEPTEPIHFWYGVANVHLEQFTTDDTAKHLKTALEMDPNSLITAQYLARSALTMLVRTYALDAIDVSLENFGDDPLILRYAGKVGIKLYRLTYTGAYGDVTDPAIHLQKARDYLAKAIAIDPSNYQAHLDMVEAYDLSDKYELAIEHILMADRLQPLGSEAYVMLGQMYAKAGDHSKAADAFQIALDLAPANAKKLEWELGMALFEAKRSEEAVDVFAKAWNRNNMSYRVRFMFGRAAYDNGDYPRALLGFREAYGVDQKIEALVWSARCAYDLGQDDIAITLVNRAIKESKQTADKDKEFKIDGLWHFIRGRALWQKGDKKAAIDDLEKAAIDDPANAEYAKWAIYAFRKLNDPYGVVRIAKAYGLNNNPDEALDVVRAIREMWTLFPPRKDHRGKTYRGGITRLSQNAIAALYDKKGHSRTAASIAYSAGYHSRGSASSWSSWLLYRGGNNTEAEGSFDILAKKGTTDKTKQLGFRGLAFMALTRRDGQTARKNAIKVTDDYYKPIMTTVLKWADVFDSKPEAIDKLDTFDLLGIYGSSITGLKYERGLSILGFIPGSPLQKADPEIKPRDIIVRVGSRHLSAWKSVAKLRTEETPKGKTPVLIRRGDRMFEVTVDFDAVRKEIREQTPKKTEVIPK